MADDFYNKEKSKDEEQSFFQFFWGYFESMIMFLVVSYRSTAAYALIGPGDQDNRSLKITHTLYLTMALPILVCSIIIYVPALRTYIADDSALCVWEASPHSCEAIVSYFIVYRFGFAVTFAFMCFAFLLNRLPDQSDATTNLLHTGFWLPKILFIIVIAFVSCAMPPGIFDNIWMLFGLLTTPILTILHILIIQDIVTDIGEKIIAHDYRWKYFCVGITSLASLSSVFIMILLIHGLIHLGRPCPVNILIVLFNTLFCLMSVIVTYRQSGWILSSMEFSLITLYVVYATRLALSYQNYSCVTPTDVDAFKQLQVSLQSMIDVIINTSLIVYAIYRNGSLSYFTLCQRTIFNGSNREPEERDYSRMDSGSQPDYRSDSVLQQERDSGSDVLNSNSRSPPTTRPNSRITNEDNLDLRSNPEQPDSRSTSTDISNDSNASSYPFASKLRYSPTIIHCIFVLLTMRYTLASTRWYTLDVTGEVVTLIKSPFVTTALTLSSGFAIIFHVWTLVSPLIYTGYDRRSVTDHLETLLLFTMSCGKDFLFSKPMCIKNNGNIRFLYFIIALFGLCICCLGFVPHIKDELGAPSYICERLINSISCMNGRPGYLVLIRVSSTLGLFYMTMCLITINVNSLRDPRNSLQSGFWPIKFLLIFLCLLTVLMLPRKFDQLWTYIGLSASLIFILMNVFCLIDLTNLLANQIQSDPNNENNMPFYGITSMTSSLFIISSVSMICFYMFFASNPDCKTNRIFLSINLTLCIASSLISIHPLIKNGGLLKSSVMSVFCMFLTWSALHYNPNFKCNPMAHDVFLWDAKSLKRLPTMIDCIISTSLAFIFTYRITSITKLIKELNPLRYIKAFQTYNDELNNLQSPQEGPLAYESKNNYLFGISYATDEPINEEIQPPYCFSLLHGFYATFMLYGAVILTHWLEVNPGKHFQTSMHWAIMCIKLVSSSISILLYIWSMLLPTIVRLKNL